MTMEDVPGQRPDADKFLATGTWRTDTHFATAVSKREKVELVFVTQVDGTSGPESDERYLLKKKLLIKFYNPDYAKYTEKVTTPTKHPHSARKLRLPLASSTRSCPVPTIPDGESATAFQGYALGAIRFRCSIADGGSSKITGVHFADALHVEKLRKVPATPALS